MIFEMEKGTFIVETMLPLLWMLKFEASSIYAVAYLKRLLWVVRVGDIFVVRPVEISEKEEKWVSNILFENI